MLVASLVRTFTVYGCRSPTQMFHLRRGVFEHPPILNRWGVSVHGSLGPKLYLHGKWRGYTEFPDPPPFSPSRRCPSAVKPLRPTPCGQAPAVKPCNLPSLACSKAAQYCSPSYCQRARVLLKAKIIPRSPSAAGREGFTSLYDLLRSFSAHCQTQGFFSGWADIQAGTAVYVWMRAPRTRRWHVGSAICVGCPAGGRTESLLRMRICRMTRFFCCQMRRPGDSSYKVPVWEQSFCALLHGSFLSYPPLPSPGKFRVPPLLKKDGFSKNHLRWGCFICSSR